MGRLTLGSDAVDDVDEFIFTFVKWGEHHHDEARSWSLDEMRRRLPDYPELAANVRAGHAVKWFENLLGSTFQVAGAASGVSVQNSLTGESQVLKGPGILDLSPYAARMGTAVEAWYRAIERTHPADCLTAAGDGLSAIEGYLNQKAKQWTVANPTDPLEDTKEDPVNTREKLTVWVPHMTGKRIDPKSPFWEHLLAMQRYRNHEAIHPRRSVSAIELKKFAQLLNMFTSGIAVPLLELHTFFKQTIPAVIIRAAYAPEVRVVPEPAANSSLHRM
ncbi:MAG: hypothetical protein ACXW5U_15905 [Thermoanaerobaculia bacterium]